MPELAEHLRAPRLLVSARIHLSRALEQRRECIRLWNAIRRDGPFSAWLEETSDDTAELWCAYRPSDELQRAVDDAAASAGDELGFRVFQRVLEDIAATDFTGDETDRVRMLAHIDRVAVTTRAELGRLLLRRLIACSQAPEAQLRVEHRLLYVDHGELHLSFTCMGKLTGYYQEMFRTWLLHRRQRFLMQSDAKGPIWPWSVGVLLTPRPSTDDRLWDTTVIATNGPPEFDDDEYRRLDAVYASVAPDDEVEDLQAV